MKRLVFLGGLVLLLATACHKADEDAFGGNFSAEGNPVREYMLSLADELVASALEELEEALGYDEQSAASQAFYDMKGDLKQPGGIWVLRRESLMKGLVLRMLEEEVWVLDFDGDLLLSIDTYPTSFTIRAERIDAQNPHTDWKVTLQGQRTERNGYSCTFSSDGPISYEVLFTDRLWQAFGSLQMDVFKDNTLVDKAFLSLRGPRSAAAFAPGL